MLTSATRRVLPGAAWIAVSVLAAAAPGPVAQEQGDAASLRAAIEHLSAAYGPRYPRAAEFLARLEAASSNAGPAVSEVRKAALSAHPALSGRPVLFVVRPAYAKDHHNTETMFQTGEINTGSFRPGGPMKCLDVATGELRTVADPGPGGLLRDPDVSFDGRRIVFSMRRSADEDYHLYEIGADGAGLRALTSAPGVFDIDPFYLADGRIAFTSSRDPKYCGCNVHIMGNLFRMEADGANIVQLGRNNLHEGHGALMDDGRILYDRWEYVDRNFGDAQGLWTVNPDGTAHAVWYGNNTPAPGGVISARPIPGSPCVVAILGSCHDRPWGSMAILDRRRGVDGRSPVVQTWPPGAADLVRDPGEANNAWDAFVPVRPRYADPWPLDDAFFLCARQTGKGDEMGLYLVDVFGNESLLHAESPGCWDPMPLGPRPIPPVVPERRDYANADGLFYVADVYEGTHMDGVARGQVKWLRVIEAPEKRFWTHPSWGGQGVHRPGMNWHSFENKRILGTVPVEADGSAYFEVPPERFVYFQLLDADGMMIQSMRSATMVQSGERAGCAGCHEDRTGAPAVGAAPLAMRRAPSRLEGWYGPPRLFGFRAEVQPVFDRHCVRCHDFGKPAGAKLNLAGDRTAIFNVAYVDLHLKKMLKVVGGGPAETQPANSWGARQSPLVRYMLDHHWKDRMTPEEFDRVVTWVDLNAPYYPSYATAYPDNLYGRCPLDGAQVRRLKDLGVDLGDRPTMTLVSFDRPEASAVLQLPAMTEAARRDEVLALLTAGRDRLKAAPNPDAPGFVACETDARREAKYMDRQAVELCNREALAHGARRYDDTPAGPTKLTPVRTAAWEPVPK